MKLRTIGAALLLTSLLAPLVPAQSLADFGIPAGSNSPAELRAVEAPGEVQKTVNEQLGRPVISAANTQDAINTAIRQLEESGESTHLISTGSGLGLVSVGVARYGWNQPNPNLVLIEQRQASLEAMLQAKSRMAAFLGGLSLEGVQEMSKQQQLLDDPEGGLANISKVSTEQLSESVAGVLRGVVVYDLQDDPATGVIKVSIVTTPKTQGAIQDLGGGILTAGTLAAGLEATFAEIKVGIVPPAGGKTVTIPGSGEIAWVGFGSEVCRKNRNAEIQEELRLEAKDTAAMRARSALLAVINGEDVYRTSDLNNQFSKQIKQFDTVVTETGQEKVLKHQQDQVEVFAAQVKQSTFGSLTTGELPEGVSVKSYYTKDGNWAYAIAIFTASSTEAAGRLASTMAENSPLRAGAQDRSFLVNPDGSFKTDDNGRLIPVSLGNGRVTQDKDL